MECIAVTLASQPSTPSLEGSALALAMLQQLLRVLDVVEPERNVLSFNHSSSSLSISPSSSSSSPQQPEGKQAEVISAANIHDVDVDCIKQFSTKSKQILQELVALKCNTWKFQLVPPDFYDQDLEHRARRILGAPSPEYLCKSLLMKNSKCTEKDCSDRLNSKYYLVVFQYSHKLKQQKLKQFVKSLRQKSNKFYKFSLASLQETKDLTQFEYNCVSPIGIGDIPVIISHHIVNMTGDYKQIWIGSGSLHIKLSIDLSELCSVFPHFVADITD